jgi:hypothetical protein
LKSNKIPHSKSIVIDHWFARELTASSVRKKTSTFFFTLFGVDTGVFSGVASIAGSGGGESKARGVTGALTGIKVTPFP